MVFAANILLILISWLCYKFPHGDEYLIMFMIPLVFMAAPFVARRRAVGVLLILNLGFFVFYNRIGALNVIDVTVLMVLLIFACCASYTVKWLYRAFLNYHEKDMLGKQRRYNSIVNELEGVDRRGRKIEGELSRISRLYEVTKKLAPALKVQDLVNALFDFLEENFTFKHAHLLAYTDADFSLGISRSSAGQDYYEDFDKVLEYRKVGDLVRKKGDKSIFMSREEDANLFETLKVRADNVMVFPLFVGERMCAILVVEGASRQSYGRFRILTSQIALEFRKVQLYEQVQKLSIIDGLTEVYLRRYMMDRLVEEVDRAQRLGFSFSIGMVDVDNFKECNDRYGHLVGDAVLKKVAERLKTSVREVDMIARYGGEEFCIMLPDTNKDLAMTVAERLRKSISSQKIKAFDEDIKVTVSVGVATFPEDEDSVSGIIEKADMALYKAKRQGRNRVCKA